MAAKKSKKVSKTNVEFLKLRLNKVNSILGRLEDEVEGIFKRLVKKGESSSKEIRKNFDEILKRVRKISFYSKAQTKTGNLEREVRKLADEVISKLKSLEIAPSGFSAKKILKDTRKNIESFVSKFEKNEWVEKAKNTAQNTRVNLLSVLNIPSQAEVEKLEKKIHNLEKRLHHISQKAA